MKPSLARVLYDSGDFQGSLRAADLEADPLTSLLLKASIYFDARQYAESRKVIDQASGLMDEAPARLKARFYGQRAAADKKLGKENLIDYEAARYWAEECGDQLVVASARNNLAKIYSENGRLVEALQEIDIAIRMVEKVDPVWLGRFLDQKAQILLDHDRLSEAVEVASRSVGLLREHGNPVSLQEAETTYGKALVRLGSSYLDSNTLEHYHSRREVGLTASLSPELLQNALEETGGHVYRAAQFLKISHSALIKLVKKNKLGRHPKRRRAKSLATLKK